MATLLPSHSPALGLMGQSFSAPAQSKIAKPAPTRHIFIITGPAGCGKSTVANFLAQRLDLPFIEGDDVRYPSP